MLLSYGVVIIDTAGAIIADWCDLRAKAHGCRQRIASINGALFIFC